jgi:hypothetical protein
MSVYNQIATDVAMIAMNHVRLDQNGRYEETVNSRLQYALSVEANLDQTPMALTRDIVLSMFDEGCIAVVPVDTTEDPDITDSFDIKTLRVGKILEWYPQCVRVRLYNEETGQKEDIPLPKRFVAIIENPLYAVMNEHHSTLKRLIRKLNILDAIDEQSGSGKLDIIIQLPYTIRSDERRKQAEGRRKDMEVQLAGSKYGIAYADGSEKITQLNRPAENNLMKQIEYLTTQLFSQLGLTEDVFKGTASAEVMLNYYNRTVVPCLRAIRDEYRRKFLTKTARSQRQSIEYFKDAFAFVPADKLADMADKYTRNEIMSSNEIRSILGLKPSKEPQADKLQNKNLNAPPGQVLKKPSPDAQNQPEGEEIDEES